MSNPAKPAGDALTLCTAKPCALGHHCARADHSSAHTNQEFDDYSRERHFIARQRRWTCGEFHLRTIESADVKGFSA